MRTYYVFASTSSPDLRGFTYDSAGKVLPEEDGPWVLTHTIAPDEEWRFDVSRAVVAAGILENSFYLWGPVRPQSDAEAHRRERPRRRHRGL